MAHAAKRRINQLMDDLIHDRPIADSSHQKTEFASLIQAKVFHFVKDDRRNWFVRFPGKRLTKPKAKMTDVSLMIHQTSKYGESHLRECDFQ